jgi:hypothetical protein
MKKLFNILTLCLFYLVFCSKSCVDNTQRQAWQTKQADIAKDSIRNEFETDYLTEEARHAAETKAIQQVKDLSDYVNIYADPSTDSLFREKAGEMVRKMFVSDNCTVSFGQDKKNKMKSATLRDFLREGFGVKTDKTQLVFDSVRVMEPLEKTNGNLYSGKLAVYQGIIDQPLSENNLLPFYQITIDIISERHPKVIGNDTLMVWEVLFKDMSFKR